MADLAPTYFKIKTTGTGGLSQEDVLKMFYNLWKAVGSICYNLDTDSGTVGADYMENVGTDLDTIFDRLDTPNGDTL